MSKVLNVFYGADRLPYKDQERQVHYPMVGNSFAGASLVDEIRFYAKDLGTENNVFVGIAKRPDGQRGYQVLTYGYDTELNEPYWTFNVSGWFTEKVGNVFVSLNVYQGGVDIEVDEDSGLAIVSGTPIIQATGSVVLSINYAPVMDNGYGAVPTIDVQEALSLVGSKVDTDYLTANYYNKTTVDGKLLLKADLSYVNGFVKTLEVSMDSSTYVITFTCKDGTGTTISTQSIDLPLESVVVSGEYDSATQSIILTLQNGNTITIPVSDLVDGLVDTTTFETAIQGIEDALDLKANKSETYDRDYIDGKLDLKADKTTTTSLQNQINDLNARLTVVEEAIIGVDTLTFTALSYSAIPNVSDNLYPIIASGGLDTKEIKGNSEVVNEQIVDSKPIKLYSRKAVLSNLPLRAIAKVDLGSLNYVLDDYRVYTTDLQNLIKKEAGLMNIVCSSFNAVATLVQLTSNNSSMYVSSGGNVSFSNMGYNATTFKQAMNGVYLYFELAMPNAQPTQDVINGLVINEYQITTEVLRSAGSVQDSAVSKKVGTYTFIGNESWQQATQDRFYFAITGIKPAPNSTTKANVILSSGYSLATGDQTYTHASDKIFSISHVDTRMYVYDSSITTASAMASAMAGKTINFELATPTEQTATLPTDIEIEKGGSLEVVYDNGYTTPADFVFDCAVYKPLE